MKILNINTFKEYTKYLFDPANVDEIQEMIDVITTHKTDFYRENKHFSFMTNTLLPEHVANNKKIDIWSAGCSTGEEVYTLAFVLNEFNLSNYKKLDYHIYGSDVSLSSVQYAKKGVYTEIQASGIPINIRKKYLLKNKNSEKKLVKISPEIREKVSFFVLNFLEDNYNVNMKFDVIMCRNTLIYFSQENQEYVLRSLLKFLKKGGYLIIGHSESIFTMDLPVKTIKTTIYMKN